MKKLFAILALAVTMIMGGQAMAQTRGAMLLSGAFPLKDYAEFEGFDNFALTSLDLDDDDAGAGIGFSVGFKWYFNVGVKGLGVMLSADGIYNGPNANLKAAFREKENHYDGPFVDGSFTYNATPKHINVPIMLGLNYIYHVNPNFGIYAEAGLGGDMHFLTKMESLAQGSLLGVENKVTTTQKYDMGFSVAYQAGIGIEVARNLIIGCSFYDLGKAQVKGDETIVTKLAGSTNPTTKENYNTFGTVHPYMIMARIGFSF
jgi:hypothetical protein